MISIEALEKAMEEFILCLEEERHYDAHEVLEALWFPERFVKDDEVMLLKGYINASVSFELFKRGRKERYEQVWKNYEKYASRLLHVSSEKQPYYEKAKAAILKRREQYEAL